MHKNKKKYTSRTGARKIITLLQPKSIVTEQFRILSSNIKFQMSEKRYKTFMITSSSGGEGKSTVAANLSVLFAQEGLKTLLVDSDLRKPTIHHTFHVSATPGLTQLIMNQWKYHDVIKESGVEGLHLITSGPLPSNPTELLDSKTMEEFINETKMRYDIVIFDAPPVLSVADAQILSNKCDGNIVVVNSGKTLKNNVLKMKNVLQSKNANIVGCVVNNFKLNKDHYYYQYYGER